MLKQTEEEQIVPSKVSVAFDEYRAKYNRPRQPRGTESGDLTIQMTWEDGLAILADGPNNTPVGGEGPDLPTEWASGSSHLWVVRLADVVHAPANCKFGSQRKKGVVKHTNITGGEAAYAAGEAIFVGASQIVVNGLSGRYRVRSSDEMTAIEMAFKKSGYDVWSTGWDAEGNSAVPFGTLPPKRVV